MVRPADSAAVHTNVLANDAYLWWAVGPNQGWFFEVWMDFYSANTTMDLKIGWTAPAGASGRWGVFPTNNTGAPLGVWNSPPAGFGIGFGAFPAGQTACGSINGSDFWATLAGWAYTGAAGGILQLQWAQNTADAGDLIMRKGSFVRALRLF